MPSHIRAVIDIGTNTIRMLLGRPDGDKVIRSACHRAVTRLGSGLIDRGQLSDDSIYNSISTLAYYKQICETSDVSKIYALGTSALREARNAKVFISEFKNKIAVPLYIISGETEAALTFRGIVSGLPSSEYCADTQCFFVDIGGGSTEWIVFSNHKLYEKASMPIGVIKLFESFLKNDPPLSEEIEAAKVYIRENMQRSFIALKSKDVQNAMCIIATGGTATTVAAMDLGLEQYDADRIHLHYLHKERLNEFFQKLISIPLGIRAQIPGIERQRADIIIPGIMVLLAIMELLNNDKMIISDYGLLEGALLTSELWNSLVVE